MEKTIEKQGEEEGEKKKSFEILPEKGKVEEDREPTKLLLTQEEVPYCGVEIEVGGTEEDDLNVPQIHQVPRVVKSASKEDEGKAANSVFKRIEPHLPNILKRMHEIDKNISSMTGDEIATKIHQENLAKQKQFILVGAELSNRK